MSNRKENEMDIKITLKDAYEELWRCRDFELEHLWQRSIFLATLLVVVYAGYGSLIGCSLDKGLCGKLLVNCYGFGIAFVGIILSLLWIMLAKGSKAWYERYESAIHKFTKIAGLDALEKNLLFENPKVEKVIAFAYGDDFRSFSPTVSSWLWNTKGGAYSPSKINIAIGQISFVIWLVAAFSHIFLIMGRTIVKPRVVMPMIMLTILFFGLIVFWWYSHCSLKSRTLKEKEHEE